MVKPSQPRTASFTYAAHIPRRVVLDHAAPADPASLKQIEELLSRGWHLRDISKDKLFFVRQNTAGDHIVFDYDDDAVRDDQMVNAMVNASGIMTAHYSGIVLLGHADTRGATIYNIDLGMRRAAAVAEAYVEGGIDTNHISITSLGESQPLCLNDTDECHARNRRVETFVYLKKEVTRHDPGN